MKKYSFLLPLIILLVIFFILKLSSLGIRASDTNIYFYTGKELLSGKLLYKDVFFTNFPLVPYVSAIYYFFSNGNLTFYYFTASLEVAATSLLLFFIVRKEFKSSQLPVLTSASYLFSFMILSTSEHQSGVFLAALLSVLSYFLYQRKKYFLAGIAVALAFLAKAYILPLLLTFVIVLAIKQRQFLPRFILGAVLGGLIILLPSLLLSFPEFWNNVFEYSLTRSQGISKSGIVWFTLKHDFLFVGLLITSILMIRKQLFFGLFSLLGAAFFFLYQDTYYLYLNTLLPLTLLMLPMVINWLTTHFHIHRFMIPTILIPILFFHLFSYLSGYATLQKLPDPSSMVQVIQRENPSALYGVNSITPALAHLSNTPLLDGIVDTNDNIYRKGFLNATSLTQDAIDQHALIVTEGVWYPEAGVTQDVLTEVVDKELLKNQCKLIKRFFFRSEGMTNAINFFRC